MGQGVWEGAKQGERNTKGFYVLYISFVTMSNFTIYNPGVCAF